MSTVENDIAAFEGRNFYREQLESEKAALKKSIIEEVKTDSPGRTSDLEMCEIIESCDSDIDEPLRVLWETGNAKPLLDLINAKADELAEYAADSIIIKGLMK